MQLSNIPGKLVLPWATSGNKNNIPVASQIGVTAGAASLTDGFPPLTMTPVAAGGLPPSGLDMNGILYEMSNILRWANAGGGYAYDSTFANDSHVGGYPKGARVMRSDATGYWFNTVDNNLTDPEAAGAAAAGWVPDYQAGATSVAMSGSSVTLTPAQYGKPLIIITGALSANLNLIFPALAQGWTVINNTTGGYSITAKTASGSGVALGTVSQIVGDGTNIYQANPDSVQIVTNVATLRNITPSLSRRIQTQGYVTTGDGGSGQYFGKIGAAPGTYVDNGGTVIVPNGGNGSSAWFLDIIDGVNVCQFGAISKGTGDDSAKIQAAVDSLPVSGGKIIFPTQTYLFKDISIIDKESVSFDFGDSVINLAAGAQYAFKLQNTSSTFKKGGSWENVTFGTGSATVGVIWVDGGAWTNQTFNRIFNNSVSAPDLIHYSNNTTPLRNPSNFTFTQIFDRSYGCKHLFHYIAGATTVNLDNFVMKNILHYCNVDGGAVIHFDGSAALYSTFENIYGGMYADNTRLVKMTGAIAASRNTWKNLLMEGSGNNRICMDGRYNESTISTVVNYIDETTYTGNQALYALLTSSKVDHLLVQNATTGNYSTNTAVTLTAGSGTNEIFEVGVLADAGYQNTVYRGKGDYVLATSAKQSIASNSTTNLFTLPPNEFEIGDTFKIFIGGISAGLYKDLSLIEIGNRTLYAITGGLTTESWSFELVCNVFLSAGNKNLSCYLKAYKGSTLQYAEYVGDRTFTSNITWALSASASSWPAGTFFVMNAAHVAPLYNQN